MVGFILMKVSSCSQSVSAPKIRTITPVISGMIGMVRVSAHETASEMLVAAIKRAVAMKIGPPSSASAGNLSASHSPRELAKKNTTSGPSSSDIFSTGLMGGFSLICVSLIKCSNICLNNSSADMMKRRWLQVMPLSTLRARTGFRFFQINNLIAWSIYGLWPYICLTNKVPPLLYL